MSQRIARTLILCCLSLLLVSCGDKDVRKMHQDLETISLEPDRKKAADAEKDLNALAPKVKSELVKVAKNSEREERLAAYRALASLKDQSLEPLFVEALDDEDTLIRKQGYGALRSLKDPDCIPKLIECSKRSDLKKYREDRGGSLGALEAFQDPRVREELLRRLRVASPKDAFLVLGALGKYHDTEVLKVLLDRLESTSSDLEIVNVVNSLGERDRTAATPRLQGILAKGGPPLKLYCIKEYLKGPNKHR